MTGGTFISGIIPVSGSPFWHGFSLSPANPKDIAIPTPYPMSENKRPHSIHWLIIIFTNICKNWGLYQWTQFSGTLIFKLSLVSSPLLILQSPFHYFVMLKSYVWCGTPHFFLRATLHDDQVRPLSTKPCGAQDPCQAAQLEKMIKDCSVQAGRAGVSALFPQKNRGMERMFGFDEHLWVQAKNQGCSSWLANDSHRGWSSLFEHYFCPIYPL